MPATPSPPSPARPRVLQGGPARPQAKRAATATPAQAAAKAQRAADEAAPRQGLPRWAKGVVTGGVLLAAAMPATVLMSRSMLVQEALAQESGSKAAMVCTAGDARAVDGASLTGWLFGGSYFHCGDWETREARVQRERDQAQANYLAREKARLQAR